MGKFKFKYDPIKRVKEQLEKKVQKEIAEFNDLIEKNKNIITGLEEEMMSKKLKFKKETKASELQFQKNYETYMLVLIDNIKIKINELVRQKNKKLLELMEKTKEKKIFIKLEEKHLEDFKKIERKIEANSIDEAASQNFVRRK
jgi:flagellar export protein FliJ